MRAKLILLSLFFTIIYSCKTKCDCEADCLKPEPEMVIITPEKSITLNELLYHQFSSQKEDNKRLISETTIELKSINDSSLYKSKLAELEKLNYEQKDFKVKLEDIESILGPNIKRRPCVFCPQSPRIVCCPKLRFIKIPPLFKDKTKLEILKSLNISDSLQNNFELLRADENSYLKINTESLDELKLTVYDSKNKPHKVMINMK